MSCLMCTGLVLYGIMVAVTFRFIRTRWVRPPWNEANLLDRMPAYCMAFFWPSFWPVWGFLRVILRDAERSGL